MCTCVHVRAYVHVCNHLIWQYGKDASELFQHPHLENHPFVELSGHMVSQNLAAVSLSRQTV